MSLILRLDSFQGPLDLLLHLIEKNELDIYNIPVAQVTDQYLDALRSMQVLDLEVASEFVVMAARLLALKARMLLPKPLIDEVLEPGQDDDPRRELVNRLLEYRRYKQISLELEQLQKEQMQRLARPGWAEAPVQQEVTDDAPRANVWDLLLALQKVLARLPVQEPAHTPIRDEVTVGEQMETIGRKLAEAPGGLSFWSLFEGTVSRGRVVVVFLALLELMRLGQVLAYQMEPLSDIILVAGHSGQSTALSHG